MMPAQLVIALSLGAGATVWAAPSVQSSDPAPVQLVKISKGKNMVTKLDSEDPASRQAAMTAILKTRGEEDKQIAALVERYVAAADRQGTVKDCMLLLGHLHATAYVPLLVKHLTFKAFYKDTKRPQALEDVYPAVPALINMGVSSIQPVIERLEKEDGEPLQLTGAAVLRGVLGQSWAVLIVEDAQAHAAAPAKGRLAQILRLLHTP